MLMVWRSGRWGRGWVAGAGVGWDLVSIDLLAVLHKLHWLGLGRPEKIWRFFVYTPCFESEHRGSMSPGNVG